MNRIKHTELISGAGVVTVEVDVENCPFCGSDDIGFGAIEGTGQDRDYGLALMCGGCGGTMLSSAPVGQAVSDYTGCADMWNVRTVKGTAKC